MRERYWNSFKKRPFVARFVARLVSFHCVRLVSFHCVRLVAGVYPSFLRPEHIRQPPSSNTFPKDH